MARVKKKLLRAKFLISGERLMFLPEILHVRKISVYNFNLINENLAEIIIDSTDFIKFFAICKNMCYNKKIIGYYGLLAPITLFLNKVGIVLGSLLFILLVLFFNNFLLDVKVVGSGACFEEQTKSVIYDYGIKKFTPFTSIDYKKLENQILSSNPRISFVTAKKQGNILVVECVLSSSPVTLGDSKESLKSNVKGTIEEISVLRGTALVNVGDEVKAGDELVGGYILLKNEEKAPTYVIARVKIISLEEYFYKCDYIDETQISIAYAIAEFSFDGEIYEISHQIESRGIRVFVKIKHTINGG